MRLTIGGLLLLLLACTASIPAQEKGTVVTPVPRVLTITDYQIQGVEIWRLPSWYLRIVYVDNLGTVAEDVHASEPGVGPQPGSAEVLIKALNKADLGAKSLERRALEHLASEGKIPKAAVTGSPQ